MPGGSTKRDHAGGVLGDDAKVFFTARAIGAVAIDAPRLKAPQEEKSAEEVQCPKFPYATACVETLKAHKSLNWESAR